MPVLDDDTAETLPVRILEEQHLICSEANAFALSGGIASKAKGLS